MKRFRRLILLLLIPVIAVTIGCSREKGGTGPKYGVAPAGSDRPEYHFAIHPLHNPAKLVADYQPLLDYLNKRLDGAKLVVESSRDYSAFEDKYRNRDPEFLLPNPWQTLQAMKSGYHVIAMAGEAKDFKGIFIVRKNSPLRNPSDLKGQTVSYPAPTALAACIMPQYFLHSHGIDVNRDIENSYVGSQESSIMNAYLGKSAAGATWPPPWRAFQREHPKEAANLKVIWETDPLINNSVMARDDVPASVRDQVRTLLAGLNETAEGKAILANMETARFIRASDADYDLVRSYVARFEKDVRKVGGK